MKRLAAAVLFLLACAPALAAQGDEPRVNGDPERARFVTADIDNFWRAYDLAAREPDSARRVALYQREYLDRGSPGLKDFIRLRIKSAEDLVAAIARQPKYYAAIRPGTLRVREMEEETREAFRRFEALYPDAVFPDVYFLIGVSNTGGTTSGSGLLIGTEMYGQAPGVPQDELPGWMKAALKPIESLPAIVAHESCHFNQKLPPQKTVLDKAIQEGSCDLIGELIAGEIINVPQHAYANPREAELWREFEADMDSTAIRKWFYNGATSKDRPADLGYFMGYKIAQAYHAGAADKRQAVREILNVQDYRDFLARSRYRAKFTR